MAGLTVTATTVVATAAPAVALPPSCTSAGLTVAALHGPNFYIDTSSTPVLRGAYAGYRITDTSGSARNDLWVSLTDFAGGSVALGSGQPSAQQVPVLGAGASASRFFYLTAQAQSATAQRHTVSVWQGRPDLPGSGQVCADTGGFTAVEETIKAAANKLTSVTVSAGTPRIGGTFTITVKGDTGTIGSGSANDPSSFWMSPAASGAWPAGAYRLVGTSLSFTGGDSYTDLLRVSGLSSASKEYTAVYTFRAVGFTSSDTSVLPVQQIASGTQIKHTDLGSIASLPAISPSVNDLTVSASASPAKLPDTGGTAAYQATVSGSAGAVLDSFTATVPAGATLVPGSVRWRGTPVPDGVPTGSALVFQGPFAVAGTADTLAFDLALPAVPGNRSTAVVATVGSATIDTTPALTDHAPATGTVNVNTFPAAGDDTVTVGDNRTSTVSVLGNDIDLDADPLTVTGAGQPGNGSVSVVDGVVSYTPANGFTGADSFSYTVADGRGGTGTATVNLTVLAPSGNPAQAQDDTATAVAGTPTTIGVLINDTGQGLAVTSVTAPGHGTATITAGGAGVEYAGTAPYTGADTFTYTVTDLAGNTSTGTVTVTVTAPVVPPVTTPPAALIVTADEADTPSGAPVTLHPLTNDSGDGPLSVLSAGPAAHGTVILGGDDVTYQPASDHWGTDSFTYTVQDAHATTGTGTVTVTVLPTAAPAADTTTVDFRTATLINVLANDPAGATVAAVTPASHGTVTLHGGTVRYAPAGGYTGADSFTYRLTGGPSFATVTVTVAGPALAAAGDSVTAVRGAAGRIDVLGNDLGTGLTVEQVTPAAHGTAELRADGVWYTSHAAFRGTDTFTYRVRDAAGQTATAAVHVTVPNAAPAIVAMPSRTVTAGETLVVPFTTGDPNGDDLVLTAGTPTGTEGAATRIRRTVSGTTLTLTVDPRFSGVVTIPVEVRDDEASAATALTVTVLPAPVTAVTGTILADPGAGTSLAAPVYVDGRPTSRTLSTRVDSAVSWRPSPAANLVGYRVTLNGNRVCTVPATVRTCRISSVALDSGDAVRVVAVGAQGTLAEPVAARITPPGATNRLLAVVYFPVSEFSLDANARRVLNTVARQARTYGFGTALMVGHTDADGTAGSNATLSQRRAAQVAAYFRRTYTGLRATHTGRGETQPVRPNTSDRNKAVNRRVEIYIG
ncbi:hypothetical protein GCM10010166_60660 [Couchioplanes caeruleus subsp. azureus]|nr:hypothetical protein GCM10010166_60660 [Couchioplanes caeruleus subsp. azureus]